MFIFILQGHDGSQSVIGLQSTACRCKYILLDFVAIGAGIGIRLGVFRPKPRVSGLVFEPNQTQQIFERE